MIDAILAADRAAPAKQRHTAKRIFERLRAEHDYAGGYTVVKDYVRLRRTRMKEVFVPLAHPPGHAQVDFGQCIGVIGGVRTVMHVFCFDLPHSDMPFVKAYPAETTEAFLDGHVSAFGFLGGVPQSILYETIGERLMRDLAVLNPIPDGLFEPCEKRPAKVSSTGLVRYRMNDYSVPTRYAFQNVLVKGFVDRVAIVAGSEIIARHERIYGRDQFVFDPKHYLALLEQKPGALDQAAPLQSWALPEGFQRIRRLLESRMGTRGKKEFIQILRLLEVFDEATVDDAVIAAMRLGAISFDAVKQLALARIERRPARLDLSRYPYLPAATVRTTAAADYASLLS